MLFVGQLKTTLYFSINLYRIIIMKVLRFELDGKIKQL